MFEKKFPNLGLCKPFTCNPKEEGLIDISFFFWEILNHEKYTSKVYEKINAILGLNNFTSP